MAIVAFFFFFNDTATTEIYTLSLHDALPISEDAFAGGWFRSGDLAVMQPDGYLKIKDRAKDIIISAGENISSLEVEDVLYRHPAVLAAVLGAKPDPRWGETPGALLELKPGPQVMA